MENEQRHVIIQVESTEPPSFIDFSTLSEPSPYSNRPTSLLKLFQMKHSYVVPIVKQKRKYKQLTRKSQKAAEKCQASCSSDLLNQVKVDPMWPYSMVDYRGRPPNKEKTRKHKPAACINCKNAHVSCDNSRPCQRCVKLNKEATCKDAETKKRGRPCKKAVDSSEPENC